MKERKYFYSDCSTSVRACVRARVSTLMSVVTLAVAMPKPVDASIKACFTDRAKHQQAIMKRVSLANP